MPKKTSLMRVRRAELGQTSSALIKSPVDLTVTRGYCVGIGTAICVMPVEMQGITVLSIIRSPCFVFKMAQMHMGWWSRLWFVVLERLE